MYFLKISKSFKNIGFSPTTRATNSYIKIFGFVAIFLGLMFWVGYLAREATSTIDVAMLNTNVYKNQPITYDMCIKYPMLKAEYEKLSIINDDGSEVKRVVTWEDWENNRDTLTSLFAAYPLMEGDYMQYRALVSTRVTNKNTVLYSYPGKEVVSFEISGDLLSNYKSFLAPGDKVNIYAIYSDKVKENYDNGYGEVKEDEVEVFKSELAFNNIMIADILNSEGDSVLDLYTYYNTLTTWQQANLDSDETWASRTEPATLLVALTPEELDRYYYYKTKSATYECALPQRNSR